MKKSLLALTFSLFSLTFAKNWDFSLTPYTGLTAGKLGEYLYSQYDQNHTVSDLQWNEILWNVGLKADYSYKNFFASGDFTYYMPFTCGKMTDSDYNTDFKTNYVVFDNNSPLSLPTSLDLGYRFNFERFSVSPVLKGIFSYQKFNGKNGKGYLGDGSYIAAGIDVPWNDSRAEYHEFYDINYDRLSVYTFIGTKLEYRANKFNLFTGFYFSPFTYAEDEDYHDGKGNDAYTSICLSFAYFSHFIFNFGADFYLSDKLALFTEVSALFSTVHKGVHYTTYGHYEGSGIFESQSSLRKSGQPKGMDINQIDIKAGIRLLF